MSEIDKAKVWIVSQIHLGNNPGRMALITVASRLYNLTADEISYLQFNVV